MKGGVSHDVLAFAEGVWVRVATLPSKREAIDYCHDLRLNNPHTAFRVAPHGSIKPVR